ncbi:GNAT family N-acetyltransferase [Dactylosporangium sp. NPDC048998]|uniref:GNAT family N-acetyltransferase n=1 Tax=Dactylosporangium sp. NPDC048998 TaxID=3363976 RepID=UPI003723040A
MDRVDPALDQALDLAWACAAAAADRIGVKVVELSAMAELGDCSALLQRVWRAEHPSELASPSMLRTYAHSGNYVAGAYRGGVLVGASVGFFGLAPHGGHGLPHLHSHLAGVERGGHGHGVGFALKLHQRAWTLARGVAEVHWTYDPLILRNAYFNLQKLCADAVEYLPEFYGPMTDGINSGDLSDRILVVWRLGDPRVVDAARGVAAGLDLAGAVPLVSRSGEAGAGDEPVVHDPEDSAAAVTVAVPADVEELRRRDPGAALRWRHAVRDALMGRLAAGHRVAGMSRDGRYLLVRDR